MTDIEHVIIGTAGHIDHGKTLLVKALTGIDADTLAEEKRRGITIELGFVFLDTPDYDKQIVFIDVPGHEKLIKTMVAGASNIDAALLVIAADEGISLQTREHFDILRLLGVKRGIVALTKSDLVTEDRILEVTGQTKNFLKDSFLENAPIIPVSAVDGNGIDDLKKAMMVLGDEVGTRHDSGIFRMPVDRVFTMRGFGTVIAGTILSGQVENGDRIEIFPEGITGKVRGIQVHHRKVARSVLGKRTALNLQDVKKEVLKRGQCAGEPGSLSPTYRLDVNLRLLKSYGKKLKNRTRIRLHVGTTEIISRLVLLEEDFLHPGQEALVQFVLESPTVALPGDRFVIRTFSPLMTMGGGEILDSTPEKHKRFDAKTVEGLQRLGGDLTERIYQVLLDAKTRPMSLSEMRKKIGEKEVALEDALHHSEESKKVIKITGHKDAKYLHANFYEELEKKSKSTIMDYLDKNPHRLAMPYEELRSKILELTDSMTFRAVIGDLVEIGFLKRKNSDVSLVGYESKLKPRDQEILQRIEQDFQRMGFASPIEEELRQKMGLNTKEFKNLMYNLLERGVLVRLSDKVVYHRDAIEKARRIVLQYLAKYPSITVAELRDILQLSRKYATAILEYFDNIGLTKRDKDVHILR
ncbi:MAG: selenocysteine-specific translation elongation factor [Candidatus Aminicenantes bacterium]|nr:MAG: selenocysteine-specific translation elongation factor [Candidatus Aminicenantes bacterium]